MFASKRLGKELAKVSTQQTRSRSLVAILYRQELPRIMQTHLPPGIEIVQAENFEQWLMDIRVLDSNPLYQGQTFRLKLMFSSKYPIEPPEVVFVKISQPTDTPRTIPIHPHIYSNGFICLDLLSSAGWSPVQTVESVCMSLQSMLTANTKNERPPDDAEFVKGNKRRPRDVNFYYHDDNV
ncbi:hypothetical protein ZTR_03113 [Talaromyces verruculosus]|nr:hypothetical protein ZTR_03113 [Talaromyces verruculosus]